MLSIEEKEVIDLMLNQQDIPKRFTEYTKFCYENDSEKKNNIYLQRLLKYREGVVNSLANMFRMAADLLKINVDELFDSSNFNTNDYNKARVVSFFAEIRTINFLGEQGFCKIKFLKEKKYKTADFYAERNNIKYVIETTTLSHYMKSGKWNKYKILLECRNKLENKGKIEQLKDTLDREKCDKMFFIAVIDTEDIVALNSSREFSEIAKELWETYKIKDLNICLFTGGSKLGYGRDDSIYPNLDAKV